MRYELILKRRFWKTRERLRVYRDLCADWRHVRMRGFRNALVSLYWRWNIPIMILPEHHNSNITTTLSSTSSRIIPCVPRGDLFLSSFIAIYSRLLFSYASREKLIVLAAVAAVKGGSVTSIISSDNISQKQISLFLRVNVSPKQISLLLFFFFFLVLFL